MKRRRQKISFWENRIFVTALSVLAGMAVFIIVMLFFSFIMTLADIPLKIYSLFALVSAGLSGFVSALVLAGISHRNGIKKGLECGLIITAIYFVSAIFIKQGLNISLLLKPSVIIISSVIGGIYGVNRKTSYKWL